MYLIVTEVFASFEVLKFGSVLTQLLTICPARILVIFVKASAEKKSDVV